MPWGSLIFAGNLSSSFYMTILSCMAERFETPINGVEELRRFRAVQVSRYLNFRPGKGFSGPGEYDAVTAMIDDAWVELRCSGALDGLSRQGRDAVYWTTVIVFPGFVAESPCVAVDFASGEIIGSICPRTGPKPDGERGDLGQNDTKF